MVDFNKARNFASKVFDAVQFGMWVWAVTFLPGLRDTWLSAVPESATVLTVQADGFLGPVHALIPTNCTRFVENDAHFVVDERAVGARDDEDATATALQEGRFFEDDHDNITERLSEAEQIDDDDGVTYNSTHIIVHRCAKTFEFRQPSWWQKVGVATWFCGRDSMSELRATRCRLMVFLIVLGFVQGFAKLIFSILPARAQEVAIVLRLVPEEAQTANTEYELATELEGSKFKPLVRRAIDVALCMAKQFVKIVCNKFNCMHRQISLLSLFMMFWHDHHYVTSFVPGKAVIIMYLLAHSPKQVGHQGLFSILYIKCLAGMKLLMLPFVFGYFYFSGAYCYNVGMAEMITKETHGFLHLKPDAEYLQDKEVVAAEWASAADAGGAVLSYLFGAHAVEILFETCMPAIEALVA